MLGFLACALAVPGAARPYVSARLSMLRMSFVFIVLVFFVACVVRYKIGSGLAAGQNRSVFAARHLLQLILRNAVQRRIGLNT